jgi:hypothetical protein
MLRNSLLLIFGLVATFISASEARAQLPFSEYAGDNRPQLSPYLQLLNRDPNAGINNYLTISRQQIDLSRTSQIQQNQINNLQRQQQKMLTPVNNIQSRGATTIRSTGHDSYYLNGSHFYPRLGKR